MIGSEQKKEAFLLFCEKLSAVSVGVLVPLLFPDLFRSNIVIPSSRAGYLTWQIP